jgi:acetyl-CoA carboxylase biotin carboxyl carrier protein
VTTDSASLTPSPPLTGSTEDTLEVIRRVATTLMADAPGHPTRLRIRAGDASLELSWEAAAAGPPAAVRHDRAPVDQEPTAHRESAAPRAEDGAADEDKHTLRADTLGTFYRSPEPGARPFVVEGDHITAGQQIALIEAMKLMIPVEADRGGRIVEILKPDAAPVEYGEPLFVIAPHETGQ